MPVRIDAPFATAERTAEILGVPKSRLEKLKRLVDAAAISTKTRKPKTKPAKKSATRKRSRRSSMRKIADLIGSVDGLPADLAARKKRYLHATGYGEKPRR